MNRAARAFGIVAISSAALSALGCGSKLPEILALEWRLESRPSAEGRDYESISVFASLKDEEGLDAVDELWILNDDSALAWKLTNEDWIKVQAGSDTWIGGSALASPELTSMPRGAYRLIAIDAAGQRVEREFRISGSFTDRRAPSASYSGGRLSIDTAWPETLALAFDGTGALIASPGALAQPSSLDTSFGRDIALRTAEVGAYGYDPSLRMGAFSKRVKTR
jgi:hypothetical protein